MSRTASDKSKLQANSYPEVLRAWKQLGLDMEDDPDVRALTETRRIDGSILNAMVLWCLSRDDDERHRIVLEGLRMLDSLKARDESLDLRKISREDFRSLASGNVAEAMRDRPKGGRVSSVARRRAKGTG